MSVRPVWQLDVDAAPASRFPEAGIALHVAEGGHETLIFGHPETEACRKETLQSGLLSSLLALSCDGDRIALWTRDPTSPVGYLVQIELATDRRSVSSGFSGGVKAAFTPERKSLIAFHGDDAGDDAIVASVIDAAGIERRRFRIPVPSLPESAVSWSPDGQLIAFDYYNEDDVSAVAVVSATTGQVISTYPEFQLPATSNGSWWDESRLLVIDEDVEPDYSPLQILDLRSGELERLPNTDVDQGLDCATLGGWLFWTRREADGATTISRTRPDGSMTAAVATAHPGMMIRRIEFAPNLVARRFQS